MREAMLSGIPELRKFCYSLPAKAQFRSANHYLSTELVSLVLSAELWNGAARTPGMVRLAKVMSAGSLSSVRTCATQSHQSH